MEPHVRYQILAPIARGDFAEVFRARDNELGREVAIKQIHQQYLADPQKLERYWQEAQLLASLEHPYIMTIYDIVRERGWLILELMQGSLQQKLAGNPIDLEDLRLTLTYILHALHFLHQNGIIHGDVKPGNLLLDKNHRVKLGDFGIARRITDDEGSVVKGTTKYIAPEVLSDQFGPVGPHSDLYSLGFSAFELMCGSHFETLFPGLNMFGRDQQIAWMMWHSAMDRRLPEIHRVLQGVPDDLARIVQKLTEKDPNKRYRSAEKVLLELQAGGEAGPATMTAEERAAAEKAAKRARLRRWLAVAGLALSVCFSAGILLIDQIFPPKSGPAPAVRPAEPSAGTITNIFLDRRLIELDPGGGNPRVGVSIDAQMDRILLNDRKATLADLQKGDQVTINHLQTAEGQPFKEILASRPRATAVTSSILSINRATAVITLDAKDEQGKPLEVYVPSTVSIRLNGSAQRGGRPVRLADLQPNDRVVVQHVAGENRRVATSLNALRTVVAHGYLVSVDTARRMITVRMGQQPTAPSQRWPVAPECQISLNEVQVLPDGKVVTLAHLRAGDQLDIKHDAQVTSIGAHRELSATGVVQRVEYESRRLVVNLQEQPSPVEFALRPDCPIQLADSTPVDLAFLRAGDTVTISHRSTDWRRPEAEAISVTPQPDPGRWAIVICQQQYDDGRLGALRHTASDAQSLRDTLLSRYRVPKAQLLFEQDATRRRLEEAVPKFLQAVRQASQLIVYFGGHGYVSPSGTALLAAKGFDLERMKETGLPLRWLVDQLEACGAAEKLLLLDTCHKGAGRSHKLQPSSAELAATLRGGPTRPVSTSVTLIASCTEGQRGLALKASGRGLFGYCVAAALAGQADGNGDQVVDADELFGFLTRQMDTLSAKAAARQTPYRFLPNANPPRLTEETQTAVRQLLGYLSASGIDERVRVQYEAARAQQPDEPDAALAYGLVALKHSRTRDAQKIFEAVQREHPDVLLPYHALGWQYFMQKFYREGIEELRQFVLRLPEPDADGGYGPYAECVLELAGKLREFALRAADRPLTREEVSQLDAAVLGRGERTKEIFGRGVWKVRDLVKQLDQKIQAAEDADAIAALQRDRRRLTFYARFDFEAAADYLRARLED